MDTETQQKIYDLITKVTLLDLGEQYEKAFSKCLELEQIIFNELVKINAKLEASR